MSVNITAQTVITASALVAAVIALCGYVFKVRDWIKKQNNQDTAILDLKRHHDEDISKIKVEQTLVVYGVLACLKGLKEQGCNGAVTETIEKIEKHLNQKAHE